MNLVISTQTEVRINYIKEIYDRTAMDLIAWAKTQPAAKETKLHPQKLNDTDISSITTLDTELHQ